MKSLIGSIILILFSPHLASQDKPADQQQPDKATQRENPVSPIPYESGKEDFQACEDRWSNFLPIWGQAACEKGYVLPRPFGLSLGYMHQDQPFDVGDIFVNGIDVKTPGVAVVDEVQNEESTATLRFDAWILPFWNVYGILGRSDGQAVGPLQIDLGPVFPLLCGLPGNDCQVDTTFDISYKADVVGFGTTIAGGYKDFFGMVDYNRSEADLDISLTDAKATVISSRIGWNGKLGGFTGVLWVGVMYQDIAQTLDLPLDIGDDILIVTIEQSTQEALNYTIGGQWDINRSFAILAEFGFGKRTSQMLNLTYRF
ncbi:MAG: hypothetical protein GWP58_09595 [Gammaproteobacteria bacterium]|jgi:hypothetical protein|nr:hypothetical protein [Gammaproteobacteria bacterium]